MNVPTVTQEECGAHRGDPGQPGLGAHRAPLWVKEKAELENLHSEPKATRGRERPERKGEPRKKVRTSAGRPASRDTCETATHFLSARSLRREGEVTSWEFIMPRRHKPARCSEKAHYPETKTTEEILPEGGSLLGVTGSSLSLEAFSGDTRAFFPGSRLVTLFCAVATTLSQPSALSS